VIHYRFRTKVASRLKDVHLVFESES
jgi:hypothetical protein